MKSSPSSAPELSVVSETSKQSLNKSPFRRIADKFPDVRFLVCGPKHPKAKEYGTPERANAKVPKDGRGVETVLKSPIPHDEIERASKTN